jgi:nitrilase
MNVAAIQMVSGPDAATNLARALVRLSEAADRGAELVVLPEYFCLLGQHDTDKLDIAEADGRGWLQDALAAAAQRLGVWIAGGTIPIKTTTQGKVRNSLMLWNSTGQRVARYDKIHLFRFDNGRECYDESQVLEAGSEVVTADMASRDGHVWRIGLSICYDMRFPELYRAQSAQGADLLLVPSAFTYTTGQAHWETLLRARAIENLAPVVAAAQGGVHGNGRRTWGHSGVWDAWGRSLACLPEGEGVVLAELDPAAVQAARLQLPALSHRTLA